MVCAAFVQPVERPFPFPTSAQPKIGCGVCPSDNYIYDHETRDNQGPARRRHRGWIQPRGLRGIAGQSLPGDHRTQPIWPAAHSAAPAPAPTRSGSGSAASGHQAHRHQHAARGSQGLSGIHRRPDQKGGPPLGPACRGKFQGCDRALHRPRERHREGADRRQGNVPRLRSQRDQAQWCGGGGSWCAGLGSGHSGRRASAAGWV